MNDDLHDRAVKWCKGRTYFGAETLITELDAALRAAETDLATARTVTRYLLDGWREHDGLWALYDPITGYYLGPNTPMSDAERAWLASIASIPTTTEDE